MLNYGPIIVTLSTSKYSLVEIRGVFYKSAYSEDLFSVNQIPYTVMQYQLSLTVWLRLFASV